MKRYYNMAIKVLIVMAGVSITFISCTTKEIIVEDSISKIGNEIKDIEEGSDDVILNNLFRNSYTFYQRLRNINGLYHNHLKINIDDPTTVGAIPNQGMGLVGLCIASEMNWEPDAEAMALQTLKAVAGLTSGIDISRNAKGCFTHFFNIDSGHANNPSYSPVDTDIMLLGAMFAKEYFSDNVEIANIVDGLVASVDQSAFIGNVEDGKIALVVDADGNTIDKWVSPYNEYMIVAWMAKNQADDNDSPAVQLWNLHYESTNTLSKAVYEDIYSNRYPVLAPNNNRFTSMFAFIFNYALVHHFSNSPDYMDAMTNAAMADKSWWNDCDVDVEKQSYEWGTGAGSAFKDDDHTLRAYSADKIHMRGDDYNKFNMQLIVSPHIVAGFSPAKPTMVRDDLLEMYKDTRGMARYEIQPGEELLWRYSYLDTNWRATSIEGVDFSCMLFGMAALPQFLGPNFFNTYNDVFKDPGLGLEEY